MAEEEEEVEEGVNGQTSHSPLPTAPSTMRRFKESVHKVRSPILDLHLGTPTDNVLYTLEVKGRPRLYPNIAECFSTLLK